MKRVVITGLGVLSSIGNGKKAFTDGLLNKKCGIKETIESEKIAELDRYPIKLGATVEEFTLSNLELAKLDKDSEYDITSQMAIVATEEALKESGVLESTDKYEIGVSVATSLGGTNSRELYYRQIKQGKEADYSLIRKIPTSCISGNICKVFGVRGIQSTVVTACSAGTNAIGIGVDMIRNNNATAVIVNGVDPFSAVSFSGFSVLKALCSEKTRPFNEDRHGLSLGEASATLIIEDYDHAVQRNAHIYAEILGYGISADAYHPTSPDPTGEGAVRSMKKALQDANIEPSEIDYINAHGTGTVYNDEMELLAMQKVFGEDLEGKYISSNKSQIGHTLGTAGVIEAVASVLCMKNKFVPGTINFNKSMNDKYNFVANKVINVPINTVLSNSFAFGGNTATVILKNFNE